MALTLSLCFTLTGCSLFNKRPAADAAAQAGGVPPPKFPANNDPLTGGGLTGQPNNVPPANTAAASVPGAILAGRVIDGFSRPPANTSIRLVSLDEKTPSEQEVAVTPEGYFTIQGLKPGTHYKLLARGKQGDRLVAGVSYTTAPNIRVLIQVKDDFAAGAVPDVPPHPGSVPMNPAPMNPAPMNPSPMTDASKETSGATPPGWNGAPGAFPGAAEPALPTSINVAPQGAQASAPANNWLPAAALAQQTTPWPPMLEIPRAKIAPPPPSLQIPSLPPPPPGVDHRPAPVFSPGVQDLLNKARIPSCVREGDRIVNFALNDVNGQPWELRQRKAKLVLVDFWGTYCLPCRETMPYLRALQSKYGPGLEVVSIAYEHDGTPQEQGYRVMALCKKLGVSHRQLLGAGKDCPVRKEFNIRVVPTLFLLDEQGFILRRIEGHAPDELAIVERMIQLRLNNRVY